MKDPFGRDEQALLIPVGAIDQDAGCRAVAARATDAEDLKMLLAILGLPVTGRTACPTPPLRPAV
ncbi:hypothetical protein [Streptomyces virginiae]|uniref:hypothetical protein n=1 Tax=Streptomyces virginiae TaxID=1961 RepID=UPI002DBC8BCD|nr:hypothetical protein [Streptomyces sp. CMAA1738]MEC4575773.1 hypothetical protein [Streptomyces sp. CMAA1738]